MPLTSLETYSVANKPRKCALKTSIFSIFLADQYEWGSVRYLIDKKLISVNIIANKSINILKLLVALCNEG